LTDEFYDFHVIVYHPEKKTKSVSTFMETLASGPVEQSLNDLPHTAHPWASRFIWRVNPHPFTKASSMPE
jgi:hypothetical protein